MAPKASRYDEQKSEKSENEEGQDGIKKPLSGQSNKVMAKTSWFG